MNEAEVYSAIGKVVVAFNSVEHYLAKIIGDELRFKSAEHNDVLCASMSFGQKLDFLCALQKMDKNIGDKERDRRLGVLKEAKALEEQRNGLVHSAYGNFTKD